MRVRAQHSFVDVSYVGGGLVGRKVVKKWLDDTIIRWWLSNLPGGHQSLIDKALEALCRARLSVFFSLLCVQVVDACHGVCRDGGGKGLGVRLVAIQDGRRGTVITGHNRF